MLAVGVRLLSGTSRVRFPLLEPCGSSEVASRLLARQKIVSSILTYRSNSGLVNVLLLQRSSSVDFPVANISR